MSTPLNNTPSTVSRPRDVERLVAGQATSDGDGVKLTRVLTQPLQRRLDPYLMLDAFGTDNPDDYIGGFPDHPHRGFETVTYMIAGRMRHRDSAGHEGLLQNGGVQWMTAGPGVTHSEFPAQDASRVERFPPWLNLPAKDKMSAPWYRDIQSADIPEFTTGEGVTVRVIAGASHGVIGAVQREATQPLYLDLHLPEGAAFEQTLPAGHNAFIYVYRGELQLGDTTVPAQRMAILKNEADRDGVVLTARTAARALLIAGQPLREPIAQYGPFRVNRNEEIFQAVGGLQAGRLGGWSPSAAGGDGSALVVVRGLGRGDVGQARTTPRRVLFNRRAHRALELAHRALNGLVGRRRVVFHDHGFEPDQARFQRAMDIVRVGLGVADRVGHMGFDARDVVAKAVQGFFHLGIQELGHAVAAINVGIGVQQDLHGDLFPRLV